MYKVFFNDRTVFFGDDFSRAFVKHKGLFYKYNNYIELNELVGLFDSLTQIKNLYILTTNIAGLRTGGTVGELWQQCFYIGIFQGRLGDQTISHRGVHFPGRFAVIGPSAGWSSFYSYGGSARPTGAGRGGPA